MILCDAAQSVAGKLYMLGGGWSILNTPPGQPYPMALGILISIPWDLANHRFDVLVQLRTEDGDPVDLGAGPVAAQTGVEAGRPPGLEPGTPLEAALAINAGALTLLPGQYVWVLELDGEPAARAPFRVNYLR